MASDEDLIQEAMHVHNLNRRQAKEWLRLMRTQPGDMPRNLGRLMNRATSDRYGEIIADYIKNKR